MSSPETRSSTLLHQPPLHAPGVDQAGQGGAEALLVGAALVGVDGVGEGVHRLGERGVPLHRDLEAHVVLDAVGRLGLEGDDGRVGHLLAPVEVLDVVDEAAVVLEDPLQAAALALADRVAAGLVDLVGDRLVLDRLEDALGGRALVADDDLEALVEEGVLADPAGDRLQGVRRGLEDLLGRVVGDGRAGALAGLHRADLLEVPVGHADGEALAPLVPAVADVDDEVAGERVDDRDADAVQTAGDLVAAAAELATGVQHRQRHRDRGHLLAGRGVGRDAPAVVLDPDAAVGLQGQHDPVAVAGQRLVDRVVDDLPDQVVEAALAGRADVHARPLAHRLEALEDLDRGGVVRAVGLAVRRAGHRVLRELFRHVDLFFCGGDGMHRAAARRASDPRSMIARKGPESMRAPPAWGRNATESTRTAARKCRLGPTSRGPVRAPYGETASDRQIRASAAGRGQP